MVVQANRANAEYGGHQLPRMPSAATLYEVGFNHFWRARSAAHPARHDFRAGTFEPRQFTRASYLEGRLDESQFAALSPGGKGRRIVVLTRIPGLMPDFWQFPTVSMDWGPDDGDLSGTLRALLEHRGMVPAPTAQIWAFLGDGRDGRAGIDGCAHHAGPREVWTI